MKCSSLTRHQMWKNWEPEEISKDITSLSKLGTTTLRGFILDEDFVDNYGKINQEALKNLSQFLDICASHGQNVMLTFMVGHMSGRNWFIPWAPENRIYENESIIKFTEFVKTIVIRLRNHPAIEGWLMSNEMSIVLEPKDKYQALIGKLYPLKSLLVPSFSTFLYSVLLANNLPLTRNYLSIYFPSCMPRKYAYLYLIGMIEF